MFFIIFVIAINIFVFGVVYPEVLEIECNQCTYQKDLTIILMFMVPIPSGILIWALVNYNLNVEDIEK